MELNEKQELGVKLAKKWYNSIDNRPFVISGYAGTGKSTLVNFIIESLGLNKDNVAFLAYTGKAASVLREKGLPALTIHKFIYYPEENKNKKTITFKLKDFIDPFVKLIIVDEISMVDEKIFSDLLSFKVKTIVLGDPFQLPPVNESSKTNLILSKPDVFLDEVMRQTLDNPILYLATEIRNGENLFKYSNINNSNLHFIRKDCFSAYDMIEQEQVIAVYNKTIKKFNIDYRTFKYGYTDDFIQPGEKVICLKNNWNLINSDMFPLVNGMQGYMDNINIVTRNELETFKARFTPDIKDCGPFEEILCDERAIKQRITNEQEFISNQSNENLINERSFFEKKIEMINRFGFGYAITVHKSQGSEFDKMLFFYEYFKDINERLIYTAITRCKKELTICI